MTKVKVIVGSTRPERFGSQPAKWIMDVAKNIDGVTFELVDLEKINLPLLDEPKPAASGEYSKDHTKAWAENIGEADGFVIITPEYNHSFPASIKNAIDFLYAEWNYKPVAFVSYGAEAGGTRAVEHLRSAVAQVRLFDIPGQVMIPNYRTQIDDKGVWTPTDEQVQSAERLLKAIAFWSTKLQPIRDEALQL